MLHFLQSNLGWFSGLGVAALLPLAFSKLQKVLDKMVASALLNATNDLLAKGDPDDDVLTLAIVHWLGKKAGSDKGQAAVEKGVDAIVAKFPKLASQKSRLEVLVRSLLMSVADESAQIEKDHPAN